MKVKHFPVWMPKQKKHFVAGLADTADLYESPADPQLHMICCQAHLVTSILVI